MAGKKTVKILLVDNDANFANQLKTLLASKFIQAQITIVSNGEDAIEEYSTERPDIIVMEILLNDKNGWQVAHYIRDYEKIWNFKEQETSMIISITQLDKTLNEMTAAVYDLDLCFEKPLTQPKKRKLLKEITNYLKSRSLL